MSRERAHVSGIRSPLLLGAARRAGALFALLSATLAAGSVDAAYTARASVGIAALQPNAASFILGISADGRRIAFSSNASNLPGGYGVFVRDRIDATTTRVPVLNDTFAVVSSDLRYFGRLTGAGIAVLDAVTSANTILCPVNTDFPTSISDDGTEAVFQSNSPLVPPDGNFASDIFACAGGTVERLSEAIGGGDASGPSVQGILSADGRYVTFHSTATNLVVDGSSGQWNTFVRDRVTDTTDQVSILPDGTAPGAPTCCSGHDITPDGRFVAFISSGDDGIGYQVYVRDRVALSTELISEAQGGGSSQGVAGSAAISDDGRYVVFTTNAPDVVAGDTNLATDVFLRDRTLGVTTRVSVATGGAQSGALDLSVGSPRISADGSILGFSSTFKDLVVADTNSAADAFWHDRRCGNGTTEGLEACDDGNHVAGDGCDSDCSTTGCGNGVATTGEACDSGAGNGSDTCCSATCSLIDADSDGICDALDACSGAATIRQGLLLDGALFLLAEDKFVFRGKAPLTGSIDPLVDGLRVVLRDAVGRVLLDRAIPGGPGWSHPRPTAWFYRDPGPPAESGVEEIKLSVIGGSARFRLATIPGILAPSSVDAPLEAVLYFSAAGGQCTHARPECRVRGGGDRILCR